MRSNIRSLSQVCPAIRSHDDGAAPGAQSQGPVIQRMVLYLEQDTDTIILRPQLIAMQHVDYAHQRLCSLSVLCLCMWYPYVCFERSLKLEPE